MNNTDPRHSIKRHADGTVDFKITRQAHARTVSGPPISSKPLPPRRVCNCTCWEGKLFGEEE